MPSMKNPGVLCLIHDVIACFTSYISYLGLQLSWIKKATKIMVKKLHPTTSSERNEWGGGGVEVQLYSYFNLGTRLGGWLTSRPGRFTPGNVPVPIL